MIGKLFIDGGDTLKTYDEDAGKEFVEDMIACNTIFLGTKWFGLPTYEDLTYEIMNRMKRRAVT